MAVIVVLGDRVGRARRHRARSCWATRRTSSSTASSAPSWAPRSRRDHHGRRPSTALRASGQDHARRRRRRQRRGARRGDRLRRGCGSCCMVVLAIYVGSFLFGWLQGRLTAGRRAARPSTRLRQRRRGEAVAAAAAVHRLPAARRAAQPRHQRHRQRRADPPADARRSSSPRCSPWSACSVMMFWISPLLAVDRAGHRAAVDRRSPAPIAKRSPAAVHGAVGVDRASSTPTSRRCTRGTRW